MSRTLLPRGALSAYSAAVDHVLRVDESTCRAEGAHISSGLVLVGEVVFGTAHTFRWREPPNARSMPLPEPLLEQFRSVTTNHVLGSLRQLLHEFRE